VHRHLRLSHSSFITVLLPTALAFAPTRTTTVHQQPLAAISSLSDEVDSIGNNVQVKNLLTQIEDSRLLTKVAQSGLLSKAQQAGLSLAKLEPLLAAAVDNPDILILVEAAGPDLLPLLPTLVSLAPPALPLLAAAVSVPPALIGSAGVGLLGAAYTALQVIPDDSVTNVALQTVLVSVSLPLAAASLAGAAILGSLTK